MKLIPVVLTNNSTLKTIAVCGVQNGHSVCTQHVENKNIDRENILHITLV